jgi:putative effector of murein hydrolase
LEPDVRNEGAARLIVVGTAVVLCVLALVKFIVVKPIFFLALAILYGVGAFFVARRASRRAVAMLAVVNLAVALFLGRYIVTNGFDVDEYENGTDFVVVLLGAPLALVGFAAAITALRQRRRRDMPASISS